MQTQALGQPHGDHRLGIPKKRTGFLARLSPSNIMASRRNGLQLTDDAQFDQSSRSSTLPACLDWFLVSDAHLQDWVQILEFSDRLNSSESDSVQAALILRKSIKHSSPAQQLRSIRLIVILVINCLLPFKLQVASRKFLQAIEDVFTKASKHSNHSHPHQVALRNLILKSFSVLAYEYQNDAELNVFTAFYNKIKSVDAPLNGAPLSESDLFFTPAATIRNLTNPPTTHQQPLAHPSSNPSSLQPLPPLRDVRAEAEIARSNARLLVEALAFTNPSEMESNEIIAEFHSKCLQSQSQLMDDIPWATAQAEQAKASLQSRRQSATGFSRPPRTDPYLQNDPNGPKSREEQLLELLLAANLELADAFKQFYELERLAKNEKEVEQVVELSRAESTRVDRGAWKPDYLGTSTEDQPQASGSSRSSYVPLPDLDAGGSSNGHAHEDQDRASTPESAGPRTGYHVDELSSDLTHPESVSSNGFHRFPHHLGEEGVEESEHAVMNVNTNAMSEKALGKMRRISGKLRVSPSPSPTPSHAT